MSKSSKIGYEFERQLVVEFKERGYVTIRSAASKVIDVIAINCGHVYMIEAKKTRQKTPRSYGTEIYDLLLMRRKLHCPDRTFLFWIRLARKKDIVLEMKYDSVAVYKRYTTADMELATDFATRKNEMLKSHYLQHEQGEIDYEIAFVKRYRNKQQYADF